MVPFKIPTTKHDVRHDWNRSALRTWKVGLNPENLGKWYASIWRLRIFFQWVGEKPPTRLDLCFLFFHITRYFRVFFEKVSQCRRSKFGNLSTPWPQLQSYLGGTFWMLFARFGTGWLRGDRVGDAFRVRFGRDYNDFTRFSGTVKGCFRREFLEKMAWTSACRVIKQHILPRLDAVSYFNR